MVWLVATHVTTMSSTSVSSSVSVVDEQTPSAIGPTKFPTTDSNKKKTHNHSNVSFLGLSLFHLFFQSHNVFNFVNHYFVLIGSRMNAVVEVW